MRINKVHCLFEQSGTFKNEFKKLGIQAEDYDIQNEYGETDHILDIFSNIGGGYEGKPSLFDDISKDDLIMAFFPCVRFENQIMLSFRGQNYGQREWSIEEKMKYDMKLLDELNTNYKLWNQMFLIAYDRGLRMIVENPYSEEHFMRRYWCLEPSIIDRDRRERGDYYKKPTQFWFVNYEPSNNVLFEITNWNAVDCKDSIRTITKEHYGDFADNQKTARSCIHSEYANRFIREFILKEDING